MSNLPEVKQSDEADGASAAGILRCLRMLADEAASLRLAGTLDALRAAIAVCAAESEPVTGTSTPDGTILH